MHPQFLYVLPANTTIYSVSILHICMCTGEAQFERHRFLTGFWVPKMVPKILQANLIFYVVFATPGKPDGACREAESIQKCSPRCQQSGFNKTTERVGRMLFLMENAHCATAGDTETERC